MRQKQAAFLNHLLDLGVAGFRVDAAKHMWPQDLAAIQGSLKDTLFGGKPFFLHEVIDLGDGAIRVSEDMSLGDGALSVCVCGGGGEGAGGRDLRYK